MTGDLGDAEEQLRDLFPQVAGLGDDFRRDAEDAENDAAAFARRRRTLADNLALIAAQRRVVSVVLARGQRLRGALDVQGGLVWLRLASGGLVALPAPERLIFSIASIDGARSEDRVPEVAVPPVATLVALLRHLELEAKLVEVMTTLGETIHGRVVAAAAGHVVVADTRGLEQLVPHGLIDAILTQPNHPV